MSKVGRPSTSAEWDVLRFELDTFVSEGEYERGLERILSAFLANQGKGDQPGAWVSGFFGSGKSHFTRVLAALWADLELQDGTRARGLVHRLSDDIRGHLTELSTRGRQTGGLWAATGTLSSGAQSFRLSVLDILLESAELPTQYGPGTFLLWLREKGLEPAVRDVLDQRDLDLEQEVVHMYVSSDLAEALLAADAKLGETPAAVLALLREQFRAKPDIDDAELVSLARRILASVSTDANPDWSRRKLPATLLVLDEVQQYIGDQSDRSLEVQTTVERLQSELDGQVMVVGTGQAALQSTPHLQKLIARYKIPVQLRSNDVDEVVRKVVLEKHPEQVPALRQLLEEKSGEIDRHLQGTRIGARGEDHKILVADYPLLPTRRRFWEAVLRAVDQTGAGGQLRSQLQLTHEATAKVADAPLGVVIAGDAIFDRLRDSMLQSGVLLAEVDEVIQAQRESSHADGELRARALALVFLINQLPTGGISDTGLQATPGTVADLLVDDLSYGSNRLRDDVTKVLRDLADEGLLMSVDGQYRLQTREGQEWDADFRARQSRIRNDDARIASDRSEELKKALTIRLKSLAIVQGAAKEKRDFTLHFGADLPPQTGAIPGWAPSVLRDLLRRTVYTGTATTYQTQQKRLPNGSHQRRWRSPEEQVALPGIAPAIMTSEEHAAVLARLDSNKATATRNNRDPEATLLRAGFIYRGHRGNRLTVGRHPERGASYRCDWGTADRHNCPRPTILARMIDPIVWDAVAKVLRNPETVAREVERRREDGGLVRDLAAMERMLASIADKQGRIAKRAAAIDDDDVAAPLLAELHALAAHKKAAEGERDDPRRRIADKESDEARLQSLSQWRQTVAANLDALTYEERRLALGGLGVTVKIWRPGTSDDQGNPHPRWQIDLAPASASLPAHLVSGTACVAAMFAE